MPNILRGLIADGLPKLDRWVLVQVHATDTVTVTHSTPDSPIFTTTQSVCANLDEATRLSEKLADELAIEAIFIQL